MRVKFADLRHTDREFTQIIKEVLASGRLVNGPKGRQFGEEWADFNHAKYGIACGNGSSALIAILEAMRSRYGIEIVILPAFSFAASAFSVLSARINNVLFVDTLPNGLIDLNKVIEVSKTISAATMVVHIFGQYHSIPDEMLDDYLFLEDAAQAHPLPGVRSSAAGFSFYPAKNLGAVGEAGAVLTNDMLLAQYIKQFISYGDIPGTKFTHQILGGNHRIDEIQAAILSYKLRTLGANNDRRMLIAGAYKKNEVRTIATGKINRYHLYPILVDKPQDFMKILLTKFEIETGRQYPYILPDLEPFKTAIELDTRELREVYPNASKIARHVVTLPIGPHMNVGDANYVADAVNKVATYDTDAELWRVNSDYQR